MFNVFESVTVGDGFCIVQPPAGLLKHINKRIKAFDTDEDNKLTHNVWAAIFVLACMHKSGVDDTGKPVDVPLAVTVAKSLEYSTDCDSIRRIFSDMAEYDFKELVEEFLFSITREQLGVWFEAVNNSSFITKKSEDDLKNDSSPAVTTGS